MSILSWDDFEDDSHSNIFYFEGFFEVDLEVQDSYLRNLLRKLGRVYEATNLTAKEIIQYANRFLFLFLKNKFIQKENQKSSILSNLVLKQQNNISPSILFSTTRNFSIQKNLSISA